MRRSNEEQNMTYEPQDFARCNGNPALEYCPQCKRNLKNSPVNPEATRQWYMGPWVEEKEPCPSFRRMKEE